MFVEGSPESQMLNFIMAMVLYVSAYLTYVRLLRYPRNWRPPEFFHSILTAALTILAAGYASITQTGFEPFIFVASIGFIAAIFGVIAAPAIAFRPAPHWVEFFAKHGNYAGLWIIAPAAIAALVAPNIKFLGLLAAITAVELIWFMRHHRTEHRRMYPITGLDLAVLTAQADGNIEAFAKRHGIDELVFTNNAVSWRGCASNTLPCPFNLYINRLGLNTAPCCREHMAELCHSVAAWLREMKVDHWIEGGTLLGAVRENGKILAWEDDVDLSVLLDTGVTFKAFASRLADYGAHGGYHVDVFPNKGFITISYDRPQAWPFSWERNRMRGEIRLDLAVYRHALSDGKAVLERSIPKGLMPATGNGGYGVPREIVLPTQMLGFAGSTIACPNRSREYLNLIYGDMDEVVYTYLDDAAAGARRVVDLEEKTTATLGQAD